MPYDPINVGAAGNDNTGDALRTAFIKGNSMLLELYTLLSALPTGADYTAQIADFTAQIAALTSALSRKTDTGDFAFFALDNQVIQTDQDIAYTDPVKEQHAKNAGLFVTIPFEIVAPATLLTGTVTYQLPRFPKQFILQDVTLTAYTYTQVNPGDVEIACDVENGASGTLAQQTSIAVDTTGCLNIPIIADLKHIDNTQPITLALTVTNADPIYQGSWHGLTVWFRGMWVD